MNAGRWLASVDSILEVDRVTTELRQAVNTGSIAPTTRVTAREVCDLYNASVDSVDGAISRLVAEGTLLRYGNSFIVLPLDRAELHRMNQMRCAIEPPLFAKASLVLPQSDIDRIDQLVADGAGYKFTAETVKSTSGWSQMVVASAASTWDRRVLEMLWRSMERYTYVGFSVPGLAGDQFLRAESVALVEALRQRNPGVVRRSALELLELYGTWLDHSLNLFESAQLAVG